MTVTVSKTPQLKAGSAERRKTTLSPELREVLHMLKSLETEFDAGRPSGR